MAVTTFHGIWGASVIEGEKGMSGAFPWWVTVNNAHHIDKVVQELENLTALLIEDYLIKALRLV